MWLNKCLKKLASEHLATANMLSSLKPCTTALPSYCFITLPKRELEKIRLTVSQILGVFASTLTADDKYSRRHRSNLPKPIQLQLSKKQKIFLHFLLHI